MANQRPVTHGSVADPTLVVLLKHVVTYMILAGTFELLFAEHLAPFVLAFVMIHIFVSIQKAGISSESQLVLFKTPRRQPQYTTSLVRTSKYHGKANATLLASSLDKYIELLTADLFQMVIFAITHSPGAAVASFIASTSTLYLTTSNSEGAMRIWIAASILTSDGPVKLLTYERSQLQRACVYPITTSFHTLVCIPRFNSALILHPGYAWRQSILRDQEKRITQSRSSLPNDFLHKMWLHVVIPRITRTGYGLMDSIWAPVVELPSEFLHNMYLDVVIPRIMKKGHGLKDSIWAVHAVPASAVITPGTRPTAPSIEAARVQHASPNPGTTSTAVSSAHQLWGKDTATVETLHPVNEPSVTRDVKTKPNTTFAFPTSSSTGATRRSSSESISDSASSSAPETGSNTSEPSSHHGSTTSSSSVEYALVTTPPTSVSPIPGPLRSRKRSISELESEVEFDNGGDVVMDGTLAPEFVASPEKMPRLYYLRKLSPRW